MLLLIIIALTLAAVTGASAAASVMTFDGWVIHAEVIAIVFAALRRPFAEGALITLITCYAADLLASGPPGLLQLLLTLAFLILVPLSARFSGRLLLVGAGLTFVVCLLLDSLLAGLYLLLYPTMRATGVDLVAVLVSAAASALASLPYALAITWLEHVWRQRTERQVALGD